MIGLSFAAAAMVVATAAVALSRSAQTVARCRALHRLPDFQRAVRLPPGIAPLLRAAHISDVTTRWGLGAMTVATLLSAVLAARTGLAAGLVGVVATFLFPTAVVVARTDTGHQRLLSSLPTALELVGRSLRSGSTVQQALAEVAPAVTGPVGTAFERIVAGTERGESLAHALQRFAVQAPVSEVRVAVAALTMAAESGGGPSRALDGVSESLHDARRLRSEVAALTSQARTSSWVLLVLPVAFVALNAVLDPSSLRFLVESEVGRACLGGGLALDAAGWVWMNRLVKQVQL